MLIEKKINRNYCRWRNANCFTIADAAAGRVVMVLMAAYPVSVQSVIDIINYLEAVRNLMERRQIVDATETRGRRMDRNRKGKRKIIGRIRNYFCNISI